ncbi:hypothetical protein LTR84_009927 [Exophiala bonariae]|uniref:DUF3533 domain-containing protein n=1 Tax=Exophiala bonariae TaxID=1690606 RepID=A0AAV9NM58_9EURO|nr:hypothetical protein LTR84_009927 [Exophiala bonariae]
MYTSIFSYQLSRPYPYRWFTYVVFLGGGAAAIALFSVISLAANGYTTSLTPTVREELSTSTWSNTFGKDVLAHDWLHVRPLGGYGNETRVTNLSDTFTSVSLYADGLARSGRALILTDLGQSSPSKFFASPQKTVDLINATLQFHQENLATANATLYWTPICNVNDTESLLHPKSLDPAAFYGWTNTGIPLVQPAYISTQYLCNVTKMKSTASVIFSVIVVDLVYLQALWALLNWAVTTPLQRVNSDAMYCAGYAKGLAVEEAHVAKGGQTVVTAQSAESQLQDEPQPPVK